MKSNQNAKIVLFTVQIKIQTNQNLENHYEIKTGKNDRESRKSHLYIIQKILVVVKIVLDRMKAIFLLINERRSIYKTKAL